MAKKKTKPKELRRAKKPATKRSNRKNGTKKNLAKKKRKSIRNNERTKKSQKRKTKSPQKRRGSSIRVSIFSRKLNKDLVIIRKQTLLRKSEEISVRKGISKKSEVLKVLLPIVLKHYKSIGKSYKDSFIFRIRYRYKRRQNTKLIKHTNYYGTPITRVKNAEQAEFFFEELVENFLMEVRTYIEKGFEELIVEGVQVQGYKI